jgi:hypothetical protein
MHDRDGSYLYHGARLEEAEKLARDYGYQLNIAEREFLEASLALLERERAEALYERAKSRSLLLISVIALITSLLGIIMSYYLLTGPATVTAMVGTGIYAGPGTQYDLLDQLPADTTSDAIGKSPDGEWWVIEKPDAPEGKGWVAASDVTTARAGSLPTVMPPPTPTPTATPAATPTTLPSPRARPTLLP